MQYGVSKKPLIEHRIKCIFLKLKNILIEYKSYFEEPGVAVLILDQTFSRTNKTFRCSINNIFSATSGIFFFFLPHFRAQIPPRVCVSWFLGDRRRVHRKTISTAFATNTRLLFFFFCGFRISEYNTFIGVL